MPDVEWLQELPEGLIEGIAEGRLNLLAEGEKFSISPVEVKQDVESALTAERLKVALERLDKADNATGAYRQRIAALEQEVREADAFEDDDSDPAEPRVIERHTKTVVHKRCWGSWVLAVVVAVTLYVEHGDTIRQAVASVPSAVWNLFHNIGQIFRGFRE